MRTSLARSLSVAALLAATMVASPSPARAQFGVAERIRKAAADKLKSRKEKTDSAIVARAGSTVDSTLEKTGRGLDTAVAKVGTATDTALNRGERGVKSLAGRKGASGDESRLAADLADDGRVVLEGLHFRDDGALDAASAATVRALAKLIGQATGAFLVEGHVAAGGGAAAEQSRAEARAKAVKAALIADGVDASRLFTMAFGATRAPMGGHTAERIEVARMQ